MEKLGHTGRIEQEYARITDTKEITRIAQQTINNLCDYTRKNIKYLKYINIVDIENIDQRW